MTRDTDIYIRDIFENFEYAESFVENITYEEFIKDRKTFYAVVRCIEIIGEAAKHIPDNIRKKYPQIPWKKIAGMRDKAIHFYFGIDREKVWLVAKRDIPKIKPHIKKILEEIEEHKGK